MAKAITAVGTAQVDTAYKQFGTGSCLLDGNSDYLSALDSADWFFGTGNFTIDLWVRFNALPAADAAMQIVSQFVDNNARWEFYIYNTAGTYSFNFRPQKDAVSFNVSVDSPGLSVNTWYHIVVVRSGSSWYFFQDGTQCGTTQTNSGSVDDFAGELHIGHGYYGGYFNGWIDEIRISKGIARWTANFTSPNVAYSWDAYTKLLIHCDGADASTVFTDDDIISGATSTLLTMGVG